MSLKTQLGTKNTMYKTAKLLLGTLALSTLISACTTERQVRGYIRNEANVKAVTAGLDNHSSVADILGNPSVKSTFDPNTWYYISARTQRKAFFAEEPTLQRILAIHFDDDGMVERVQNYSLSDAHNITPNKDKTPTRGRQLGFWEQIFGNVGRFAGQGPAGSGPRGQSPIPGS
jgi:outer membrane protein assembly factor BamE (lipoprotein component of BamABCDE complex)